MLKRKVPPDVLESTVPQNLLPSGNEPGDVVGVDMVALIIGNSVHGRRRVEVEKRGIVGFLVKRLERKC